MDDRWLRIDGMHNVRDLGGLPVCGGEFPRRVVLRGETVVHLTPSGLESLRAAGVERVLDLRELSEAADDGVGPLADLYQHGEIAHERVPLIGPDRWMLDPVGHVHDPESVARGYVHYLGHGSTQLTAALARFAWSDSAMYVHCAVGKDRTGVVCALLLKLAGATDDTVIDDHLLTADAVRPVIAKLGSRPAYPHLQQPDWAAQAPSADAMRLFLADLAAQGGAARWMLDHGMEPGTLDLLRARLGAESAREIAIAG
jgi:protein-tyrosine phosphatase